MAKNRKNNNKGRGRRQGRNGKGSSGSSAKSYERSVVRREIQSVGVLKVPITTSTAYGYSVWGTTIGSSQEFKELADLYVLARITRVTMRFLPQPFHATAGPTYSPVVGSVAHDPTNQVLNTAPSSYADLAALPSSRLWSSTGQGDASWKSCTYRAPLNTSGDYSNTTDSVPAGSWASCKQFSSTVAGITGFAAQVQNGVTNTTIEEEVLQILMTFCVEFKTPCMDQGVSSHRSGTLVLCRPLEASEQKSKEAPPEEVKEDYVTVPKASVKTSSQSSSRSSGSFSTLQPVVRR